MPIARYFTVVGSALVVLLLISDWCLPTPSAMFGKRIVIDRSIIRIKSARKWPEKVVLDTSQPTRTPPAVEEVPPAQVVRLRPDEAGGQSNLEAMAELKSRSTVGRCLSSTPAHQARFGKDRSIKACGQRSRYTSAGKSGREWGLLSV